MKGECSHEKTRTSLSHTSVVRRQRHSAKKDRQTSEKQRGALVVAIDPRILNVYVCTFALPIENDDDTESCMLDKIKQYVRENASHHA